MCDNPFKHVTHAISGALGGIVAGLMGGTPKQPDGSAQIAAAKKNADRAYNQADQAYNKANGKQPNVQGLLDENVQAALGSSGSTMLTGSGGVSSEMLSLGKNTLLGQ